MLNDTQDLPKKVFELNGITFEYTEKHLFEIQLSKGKGNYKTKFAFQGNPAKAFIYYNAIKLETKQNKRLICKQFNVRTIIRELTKD